MKIRIRGNALRLRLTQSEVKQFAEAGKVSASIQFGPTADSVLHYSIYNKNQEQLEAIYSGKEICVNIPSPLAQQWANSEQVGIEHEINLGNQQTLKILIEKDFQCLNIRPGKEDADTFPNPHA